MKKFFSLIVMTLASMAMMAGKAGEVKECKLYFTNFQDWTQVSKGTSVSTQSAKTKYSNEDLTFSFCKTEIKPDGTNSKFTSDIITPGYAMADKKTTPYIETSELKSITKVHFVHAATGSERGWGLQYKVRGETEWTTASDTYCQQAGTAVDVAINKENVQLRWYNLNGAQNAYMTELAIYGMAEDDGQPTEYTISYFDQYGVRLGEKVQTEAETLVFAYGEADLTIPEGYKFRGWYDGSKTKHVEGEPITGDLRLNALVTKIEKAEVGTFWSYDLSSSTFYAEDHELIDVDDSKVTLHLGGLKTIIVQRSNGQDLFSQDENSEIVECPKAGLQSVTLYFVKEFMTVSETGYKIVPAGDAASLLLTLRTLEDNDKVFVPNGVYDLGETVLTQVSKKNVAIVGQSMSGTVIKNAPDYRQESINNTATLYLTGENIYLQDLTIQNALDYYRTNNGRAVALWSKCSKVICKNVRLLSYQDTYYSNKIGGKHYFEDCEIHGTVDFICGDGSVYFLRNLLYCERRGSDGGGTDVITASNADPSDAGYVFESCIVKSECPNVSLGRAWNNEPQVAFLNTTFDYSAGNFSLLSTRWTPALMNPNAWPAFGEYNTRNAAGELLTPESNVVRFVDEKSNNATRDIETVLSANEATAYTIDNALGEWGATAQADVKQAVVGEIEPNGIYLIETEEGCSILRGSEIETLPVSSTIRKANARGGFGKKAGESEGIEEAQAEGASYKFFREGQLIIVKNNKAYNVYGMAL